MLILITGGSCAGKSTFAGELAECIMKNGRSCQVLSTDLFYREPPAGQPLDEVNFDSPGTVDMEEMERVILSLMDKDRTRFQGFTFQSHRRSRELDLPGTDTVILEGIFAFHHPRLLDLAGMKIYIETPDSLRYKRRLDLYSGRLGQSREFIDFKYFQQAEPFYREEIREMKDQADRVISGEGDWSQELKEIPV